MLGGEHVTGWPVRPDRFMSQGLDGGAADTVAALFAAALIGAVGVATLLAARGGGVRRLGLCSFAAVLALVALGKVLSPQYVVWLMPFAALAWVWQARAAAALTAAAALLTLREFPTRYWDLVDRNDGVIALVAARDLLLVAALGALLSRLAREPATARSRRPAVAATR